MSAGQDIQNLLPCPCCGSPEFDEAGGYEICRICNWEDDPVQRKDPNYSGGANRESLNQAKANWKAGQVKSKSVRPRLP